MQLRNTYLSFFALCICAVIALPCMAQDAPPQKKNVLTVNPFGAMFGWYSGEYERVLSPKLTVAVSGSVLSIDDGGDDEITFTGADLKLKLYPQESAASGLFFGGRLGTRKVEETISADILFGGPEPESTTTETTFVVVGFEIGFQYLFGSNQRYAISVGAGVNKLFGDALDDQSLTYPTVEIVNVGIAF